MRKNNKIEELKKVDLQVSCSSENFRFQLGIEIPKKEWIKVRKILESIAYKAQNKKAINAKDFKLF